MIAQFRSALAVMALPLALSLAACGDSAGEASAAAQSEPVAKVAAPAGAQWVDTVKTTPEGGWLVGNPDAPIKLVEYGSVLCPACAAFGVQGMEPLMNDYVNSGRVSYEFRSVLIHGTADLVVVALDACGPPEAVVPRAEAVWQNLPEVMEGLQGNAQAAEAAMQLPEDQRFVEYAARTGLLDYYAKLGLNRDQARQCLADAGKMRSMAEQMQEQAGKENVQRTPTFLVNGREVEASSWAQLEPLLQRAGAR
ncbi:DsbA family protein [Erythrobacter sp. LQ02-29]|uniref:thioredoxin domain-containing protein n=1 Tax=Erythrobacter sp. LQ02-29 TaxID=2920384 RepID=UPI001F4E8EBE|nr:thioredoxin domain-containing protein [Erythrobacter sp. LQ02-29]MCP9222773.1 DsbA family protein [Erythrobacter sp. LQ02-29]